MKQMNEIYASIKERVSKPGLDWQLIGHRGEPELAAAEPRRHLR